jgi:hypothetical protein
MTSSARDTKSTEIDEKKTLSELLWSASADGNLAVIEALVERGADVNAQQV